MRYDGPAWLPEGHGSAVVREAPEFDVLRRFVGSKFHVKWVGNVTHGGPRQYAPAIITLEGPMRISPGDWVIKGVKGEFYPCKPDVFEQTYEVLDFGESKEGL